VHPVSPESAQSTKTGRIAHAYFGSFGSLMCAE